MPTDIATIVVKCMTNKCTPALQVYFKNSWTRSYMEQITYVPKRSWWNASKHFKLILSCGLTMQSQNFCYGTCFDKAMISTLLLVEGFKGNRYPKVALLILGGGCVSTLMGGWPWCRRWTQLNSCGTMPSFTWGTRLTSKGPQVCWLITSDEDSQLVVLND